MTYFFLQYFLLEMVMPPWSQHRLVVIALRAGSRSSGALSTAFHDEFICLSLYYTYVITVAARHLKHRSLGAFRHFPVSSAPKRINTGMRDTRKLTGDIDDRKWPASEHAAHSHVAVAISHVAAIEQFSQRQKARSRLSAASMYGRRPAKADAAKAPII